MTEPTRGQVEQAYIDGSVEGSPINRDGDRQPEPMTEAGREMARKWYPHQSVPTADILAIEAEARASLDVDALARAQVRVGIDTFLPRDDKWVSANDAAAAIAAEYRAILAEKQPLGEPE